MELSVQLTSWRKSPGLSYSGRKRWAVWKLGHACFQSQNSLSAPLQTEARHQSSPPCLSAELFSAMVQFHYIGARLITWANAWESSSVVWLALTDLRENCKARKHPFLTMVYWPRKPHCELPKVNLSFPGAPLLVGAQDMGGSWHATQGILPRGLHGSELGSQASFSMNCLLITGLNMYLE